MSSKLRPFDPFFIRILQFSVEFLRNFRIIILFLGSIIAHVCSFWHNEQKKMVLCNFLNNFIYDMLDGQGYNFEPEFFQFFFREIGYRLLPSRSSHKSQTCSLYVFYVWTKFEKSLNLKKLFHILLFCFKIPSKCYSCTHTPYPLFLYYQLKILFCSTEFFCRFKT